VGPSVGGHSKRLCQRYCRRKAQVDGLVNLVYFSAIIAAAALVRTLISLFILFGYGHVHMAIQSLLPKIAISRVALHFPFEPAQWMLPEQDKSAKDEEAKDEKKGKKSGIDRGR
jgi:hypothetical protein